MDIALILKDEETKELSIDKADKMHTSKVGKSKVKVCQTKLGLLTTNQMAEPLMIRIGRVWRNGTQVIKTEKIVSLLRRNFMHSIFIELTTCRWIQEVNRSKTCLFRELWIIYDWMRFMAINEAMELWSNKKLVLVLFSSCFGSRPMCP